MSHYQDGRHVHTLKKKIKIFFSGAERPINLKLAMQHQILEYYQVYSNETPVLTLTYFTTKSNLVPYSFVWEKVRTMDFSETIVVKKLVDAVN